MATYPVTKEDAAAALRAAAWTRPSECGECGRPLENPDTEPRIHRRGSFTGADIRLADALADVDLATDIGWQPDLTGHELAALVDGRIWSYEVRAPDEIRSAWTRQVVVQAEEG